jgi:hypothetical protein
LGDPATGPRVAEFFMCSPPLFPSSLFLPGFVLKDESFIAVLSVQKFGTLSFANRVLLLQTYLRVSTAWKITDHPREPPATLCRFLLSHVRAAVRTCSQANRCQGRSPTVTRQRMDAGHPKRSARQGSDEHMPKVARALADYAVR